MATSSGATTRRVITLLALAFAAAVTALGGLTASAAQAAPIAAGSDHFCAINADRQLACWGDNRYGQLGTGDTTEHLRPVVVPGLADVRSVAASGSSTCAVVGDGGLWCWGVEAPTRDESAIGAQPQPPVVQQIREVTDVAISSGGLVCALLRDRTVRCHRRAAPPSDWSHISGATGVTQLTALCARRAGRPVLCWDSFFATKPVAVSALSGAKSIALTDLNLCGVFRRGVVRCSGETPVFTGTLESGSARTRRVPGISDASALGTGVQTCAVRRGRVTCPNLADAVATRRSPTGGPRVVAGITDARAVASTSNTVCAVRRTGEVVCWGSDPTHAGTGATSFAAIPVDVSGLSGVKALSAGRSHTCALRSSGRVSCWGGIGLGELGSRVANDATLVRGVRNVTSLTGGTETACATTTTRALRCWGPFGEAGRRYVTPRTVGRLPAGAGRLSGMPGCLPAEGRVRCVQIKERKQRKRTSFRLAMTTVPEFAGATNLASNGSFDCAVTPETTVVCRGQSWLTAPARGDTGPVGPTPLPGIRGVKSLSAGDVGSCALLLDRTVTCWGLFDRNDGSPPSGSLPPDGSRLKGFTDVRAIAATGPNGPCAVHESGAVVCTRPPVRLAEALAGPAPAPGPYVMPGISDAVDIVAGAGHACVLRSTGAVACWGDGAGGALGDGPAPAGHGSQSRPAPVPGLTARVDR